MSRSFHHEKGPGFEYWQSRYSKYKSEWHPGRLTKKLTHKQERLRAKYIQECMENEWEDEIVEKMAQWEQQSEDSFGV